MIPRGKLDITYAAILKGIIYCATASDTNNRECEKNSTEMLCLSVRTGLHLVLTSLNFPAQSEILVTDINIPDMFHILDAHRLKVVPLSVNKHSLNISAKQVEEAINQHTKAIVITHLFGAVMDTDEIAAIAKKKNIIVIEDCAQAFKGNAYQGNKRTDVAMFSFGLIKTNTALSGALLKFNNKSLFEKTKALNAALPLQPKHIFLKKLLKAVFIKLLTTIPLYSLLYKFCKLKGKDFDEMLSAFTRGFPGDSVIQKISFRPCAGNIKLIEYRLKNYIYQDLEYRISNALAVQAYIPDTAKVGYLNKANSYWVLPVSTPQVNGFINYMRTNGFDATQKASSLVKIAGNKNADAEELHLSNLVYLPVQYLSQAKLIKLVNLIKAYNLY